MTTNSRQEAPTAADAGARLTRPSARPSGSPIAWTPPEVMLYMPAAVRPEASGLFERRCRGVADKVADVAVVAPTAFSLETLAKVLRRLLSGPADTAT
mmetsp:Transcript_62205/g.122931  ORF Transcript_62205/g.122931 Transcript_62205/m.122931 type:complete len:98 (-) Transcript_62205:142-435(-)